MKNRNLRVLLIEDNEHHIEVLRHMFEEHGRENISLTTEPTLHQGLERLKESATDVILLDLRLPDSEGIDTFFKLQKVSGDIPIIILSGLDDQELALKTVQHGAADYLVKGRVDSYGLIRSITYALERSRIQEDLRDAQVELEDKVMERTSDLLEMNEQLQREITERKRAEEQLRESNQQLTEALSLLKESQKNTIEQERLHALGRMASGIAHDFNNALAPVLGFSELLLLRSDAFFDHEKTRSYIQMINAAAKESAKIVSRLREFYRYREDTELFVPVSVNDVIREVISAARPAWKTHAENRNVTVGIRTKLQNVPTVSGNENQLREMLSNIVQNAVEAITRSGVVTFRTYVREKSVIIQITDNGRGMSEEVRSRCLEPFFSTKERRGSGLGLGIVYGIVRRHHGEVDIISEIGKGTTVTISLPIYKQDEMVPERPPVTEADINALRILVVEDEPLVREVVMAYLSDDNHLVETATNGKEGLEKFKAGEFDLVITDRAMPELNGDQLAMEIHSIDPKQPVMLLTGFGDLMSDAGEKPMGVDLVVSKPFTLKSLREGIAKVMKKNN